jgi:quercetin dioxygenase-like cupin family protein
VRRGQKERDLRESGGETADCTAAENIGFSAPMSMNPSPLPCIVPPGGAQTYEAFGDRATFFLTGDRTGGRYTMFVNVTAPGNGPPPHWHDHEDEWFHVLEGRAEFLQDGQWTEVPPGTTVFMPRGTVHSFRNAGDTPLKQVIHTAPSGFETFFARIAEEFHREGGPDMAAIATIAAEHGIHFA